MMICKYVIHVLLALACVGQHGFRELFQFFFEYESMGANDPQDMAILDPRGIVGKIYIGDHY